MLNGVLPATQASGGGINRVFVYGTLKNMHGNHERLGPDRQLKGYSRVGGYVMVDLGHYPGAVKVANGGWHIYGEIYDISDKALGVVDALEGHPEFYSRHEIDTEHFGKCWLYTLPTDDYLVKGCKFVPSGRWELQPRRNMYFWDPAQMERPNNTPLISARTPLILPGPEPKGAVVPEAKTDNLLSRPVQVGPGFEEA